MNRFHNQSSLLVCDTNITPNIIRASYLCKNFQKKVKFDDLERFFVNLGGFLTQSSSIGNKTEAHKIKVAPVSYYNKAEKRDFTVPLPLK